MLIYDEMYCHCFYDEMGLFNEGYRCNKTICEYHNPCDKNHTCVADEGSERYHCEPKYKDHEHDICKEMHYICNKDEYCQHNTNVKSGYTCVKKHTRTINRKNRRHHHRMRNVTKHVTTHNEKIVLVISFAPILVCLHAVFGFL